MTTTLSYHNDPALKAAHIAQAEHHREADMLRSGTYGGTDKNAFKGCSVGCFAYEIAPTRDDYHAVVAEAAGWPEWLVRLSDSIFEGLPEGEREDFHVELRSAWAAARSAGAEAAAWAARSAGAEAAAWRQERDALFAALDRIEALR